MEGSIGPWLRCYRCWSQDLEVQEHYEGVHRLDPLTGERSEMVDEVRESVIQCISCRHDQPHLALLDGRIEPVEDRWERMVTGTPRVASCTVTVDAELVEDCAGDEAAESLAHAAFGTHGTHEFFTHIRFHEHAGERVVIHLLVELYGRSNDEVAELLEDAARGELRITSLAEESRPPAATGELPH